MGDGRIFQKISAPHSLMMTYRMSLIPDPSHWTVPLIKIVILQKLVAVRRRLGEDEARAYSSDCVCILYTSL
jgi:hypothetical protein